MRGVASVGRNTVRYRLLLVSAALLLGSCALRPQYRDLLAAGAPASDEMTAVFFPDPATGAPLSNVKITIGDGPQRIQTTTDAEGRALIPRVSRFEVENPVVVLERPDGRHAYSYGKVERRLVPPADPSSGASSMADPVRLVSYNVRYFGNALRGLASTPGIKRRIAAQVLALDPIPDVICLQEVETLSLRSTVAHPVSHPGETQL